MSIYKKINTGYVPANMPGGPTMNNDYIYKDKILGWWNEKCILSYPKILISAYHVLNAKKNLKVDNLGEYFNINKNIFIIMDSGGFSMSTLGDIDITPKQVIDLSIEFNADIMMSLDIPPYNLLDKDKPFSLPINEFNEKMEISYKNAKYQSENLQNFNGKYYICIHGDNIDRLNLWFDKHKDLKKDGIALAPKNKSDYWVLARTLLWVYHKNIRENVHFLAFSGNTTIPILIYFSQYIKNLTYDSSSWAGGAMRREYILPLMKDKIIYGHSTNYNINLPCDCKLCSKIDTIKDFHDTKLGGALMSLHNLLEYEKFDKLLYGLVKEKELYRNFIKIYMNPKLLEVLDYIDFSIKNGFEIANKKYRNKFNDINLNEQQPNLYNF